MAFPRLWKLPNQEYSSASTGTGLAQLDPTGLQGAKARIQEVFPFGWGKNIFVFTIHKLKYFVSLHYETRQQTGVGCGEGGGKVGRGEYQWFCHSRNLRFSLDVTVSVSPNIVYTHCDFKITIILDLPLELVF